MKTKIIGLLSILLLSAIPTLLASNPNPDPRVADTTLTGSDTLDVADTTRMVTSLINTPAQFPGGDAELNKYIQQHLSYPAIAQQQGIQGHVTAYIQIDKTGKITSVIMLNDIGGGCASVVEELLLQMPVWIPPTKNGEVVNSQTYFTFTFKL